MEQPFPFSDRFSYFWNLAAAFSLEMTMAFVTNYSKEFSVKNSTLGFYINKLEFFFTSMLMSL